MTHAEHREAEQLATVFNDFYAEHYDTALRHAELVCGFKDDEAEQLASDALLRVHEALKQGIEIEHPHAFVCKQVRIEAGLHTRRECRTKRGGKLAQHPLRTNDFYGEHVGFKKVDLRDTLQRAWEQLSDSERKIAMMAFIQNRNQHEMAEELDMPLRTMQRNIRRLRSKLRILLS